MFGAVALLQTYLVVFLQTINIR